MTGKRYDLRGMLVEYSTLISGVNAAAAGSFGLLDLVPEDAGFVNGLRAAGTITLSITFSTLLCNSLSNDNAAPRCGQC